MSATLARLLGLRPLDRVQLADRQEIREMMMGSPTASTPPELPFLFFEYVTRDGHLALRSPNGYACRARPADVCDVVLGTPLVVRAMTEAGFLAYLRRTPAQRAQPPDPGWYARAYVLHAEKDRWKQLGRTAIWFLDDAFNRDGPSYWPLHQDDRPVVQAAMRRTRMPVLGSGRASGTADQGVMQSQRLAAATVRAFMQAALAGRAHAASTLAAAGIAPPGHAALNRLRAGTPGGSDAPQPTRPAGAAGP